MIAAVPLPDPEIGKKRQRFRLMGELSSTFGPSAGIRFLPSKLDLAGVGYVPKLEERFPGHLVAECDAIRNLLAGGG